MRIVLLGNAGAGKSTLARQLIGGRAVARLALDEIAWNEGPQRKPLGESRALLMGFIQAHRHWVIEGCYGDLIETALLHCDELIFLNPGVDTCIAHCRRRPWEAEKFASATEQQAMLDNLIQWVGEYPIRQDEYGLARHRALFEGFTGRKREYQSPHDYPNSSAE
ncbi:shikimate kinase [Pseudomonas sp. AOB-7]|uniref:shikimate kinase n=1 Tax=Pseudomonas sp. AOB-7 TaxID=2482750 RepID=UPI000EFC71CA|nr:shikimate kinase [Pseudomonas sp. AOB-7]RMH86612.1 shikimate kinase [Pseudomonas sp. AOB-7]